MEMFLGTVTANEQGDWILSSTKSTETHGSGEASNGKFVAYDVFLKTDDNMTVDLTADSKVEFKDQEDKGIKNATRVAFVTLGHTTADDTIANIQGLNTGDASTVKIWEPNYDVHTSYGVANARDTYGITTLNAGTGNAIVPYSGIKKEFDAAAGITLAKANATDQADNFQAMTPDIQTKVGNQDAKELFTLEKGVTKVRVYMWVEGQDVDCENNASGGQISFTLQFAKK